MRHAFSLFEILVVVMVLGIMAAVAIPKFVHSATDSKVAATAEDLRSIETALGMYYARHGQYPKDEGRSKAGEVFKPFFKSENAFEKLVPIGGIYDYEGANGKTPVQISIRPSSTGTFTQEDAQLLDEYIDDGNLYSGEMQQRDDKLYFNVSK